jgi:hypothetical protein
MLTKFYLNEKAKFRIIARKMSDFVCLAFAKKLRFPASAASVAAVINLGYGFRRSTPSLFSASRPSVLRSLSLLGQWSPSWRNLQRRSMSAEIQRIRRSSAFVLLRRGK